MRAAAKPDYANWKSYFTRNQTNFDAITWNGDAELSGDDRRLITRSLQQFQRGEHPEGRTLLHFAKLWNAPFYTDAIELFVREEQRHAMVLARFMKRENIARMGSD